MVTAPSTHFRYAMDMLPGLAVLICSSLILIEYWYVEIIGATVIVEREAVVD